MAAGKQRTRITDGRDDAANAGGNGSVRWGGIVVPAAGASPHTSPRWPAASTAAALPLSIGLLCHVVIELIASEA